VKEHGREEPAPNIVVSFSYDDVFGAYRRAIENGAKDVAAPEKKPWGMTAG
jgi:hypothetical protein